MMIENENFSEDDYKTLKEAMDKLDEALENDMEKHVRPSLRSMFSDAHSIKDDSPRIVERKKPSSNEHHEGFLKGVKDLYRDIAERHLLVESYKMKQSGYDITKGKYLNDFDPDTLSKLIADRNRKILEEMAEEIKEKCTKITYNFGGPQPKYAYIATKPDGSIVDSGYIY